MKTKIEFNDFVVGKEYSYDYIEPFNEGIDDSINGWSPENEYEYIEYGKYGDDEQVGKHIIYIQHIDSGETLVFLLIGAFEIVANFFEIDTSYIYKLLGREQI